MEREHSITADYEFKLNGGRLAKRSKTSAGRYANAKPHYSIIISKRRPTFFPSATCCCLATTICKRMQEMGMLRKSLSRPEHYKSCTNRSRISRPTWSFRRICRVQTISWEKSYVSWNLPRPYVRISKLCYLLSISI